MLRKKYFFFFAAGEIFFGTRSDRNNFSPWPKFPKRLTSDNKSHFYTYLQVLIANKRWLQLNSVKNWKSRGHEIEEMQSVEFVCNTYKRGGETCTIVFLGGSEFFRGD